MASPAHLISQFKSQKIYKGEYLYWSKTSNVSENKGQHSTVVAIHSTVLKRISDLGNDLLRETFIQSFFSDTGGSEKILELPITGSNRSTDYKSPRIWKMPGCKTLARIQVSAIFHTRDIRGNVFR